MSMSETQTFGFGDNVLKLLARAKSVLEKGGMDVELAIATLQAIQEAATTANAVQHDLRRQAKAATVHSDAMTHRFYVAASGFLDMAIAAAGKDSDAAAEFRTLRSRVDRPPREPEVPESVEVVKK